MNPALRNIGATAALRSVPTINIARHGVKRSSPFVLLGGVGEEGEPCRVEASERRPDAKRGKAAEMALAEGPRRRRLADVAKLGRCKSQSGIVSNLFDADPFHERRHPLRAFPGAAKLEKGAGETGGFVRKLIDLAQSRRPTGEADRKLDAAVPFDGGKRDFRRLSRDRQTAAVVNREAEFGGEPPQRAIASQSLVERGHARPDVEQRRRIEPRERARHDVAHRFRCGLDVDQAERAQHGLQRRQGARADPPDLQIAARGEVDMAVAELCGGFGDGASRRRADGAADDPQPAR